MSHMVIYRGSDGKPGYHQTDDIHDAVGFVEQMRNDQGVEHARIFRLEEVVFQYKPYYRVELAESGFGELDPAADSGTGNGNGNGFSHGSENGPGNGAANGELSISVNGGAAEPAHDGSGSPESTAPATTSSSSSMSTPTTDEGASKRGLFGR